MGLKGIIMAGGEGKRFRPLTYYFQKCMIPIGEDQKPILEYIIRLLKWYNLTEISLLVGYRYQQVQNYFGKGERFGVKLRYILDPPNLKGSANALLNAYKEGAIGKEDTLVIYYGDIISNINIEEMLKTHAENNALVTIALAKSFRINEGVAEIQNSRIVKFIEKPALEKNVSIGIMVFDGKVLELIDQLSKNLKPETFDLMGDVVSNLVNHNKNVVPYLTGSFWYDIGSLERFERLDNQRLTESLGFLFK